MKISAAKKQATLEAILKQAYLAFTQEPYEQVKLSAISKAAHIAEGTLFNYFKDKPTLFIATFITHRSGNQEVFQVQTPETFEGLIDELIAVLNYYMKIDDPQMEAAFKRFIHLVREQQLSANTDMAKALFNADQFIYKAVIELLEGSTPNETNTALLFEIVVKQVEGLYNDYLYGVVDFKGFLALVRTHLSMILRPYIHTQPKSI